LLLPIASCDARDSQTQSGDFLWFSPDGYEALFEQGNLHDIEIIISQQAWDAHLRDMRDYAAEDSNGYPSTGIYQPAMFVYRGPAGDAVIDEVGFRTQGRSSRIYPEDENGDFHRSQFKIRFNETFDLAEGTSDYELRNERRFCTLRALNLRINTIMPGRGMGSAPSFLLDPTQISRVFCYDLMNRAGGYTSRTGFAKLTITIGDESHYFGVYQLIEPIDRSFLTRRYGKSANDGNLYKCAVTPKSGPATLEPLPDPNPFTEPRIIGVEDSETYYRPTYDLKTNEEIADHAVLLDFIEKLDTLEGGELKEYLDDNFEVDRFLRHQVIAILIGKWDDYWTMGNNYYLYFNNNGKIEFIPCDYDIVLGQGYNMFSSPSSGIYEMSNQFDKIARSWADMTRDNMELPDYGAPLIEKILQIDQYREKYEQYFREFIVPANRLFVYSEFARQFKALHEMLSPYLENDTGEGAQMINSGSIASYFYERTRAVVDELGLDANDYEVSPVSLMKPTGVEATASEQGSITEV